VSAHPTGVTGFRGALLVAACALASGGCIGNIGDRDDPAGANGPGSGTLACDDGSVHTSVLPLRRMSPEQYESTLRDLFGDAALEVELDEGVDIISEREVRQLRDAAEKIIGRRGSWTLPVFPCDTSGEGSEACAGDFVDGFAARAFRRPLSADERGWLMAVYQDARTSMTFAEAMETLLQVVLQAPAFVYLFAAGDPDATDSVRLLTDHEVASRLSYFLWNTMPDDALMAAAASGELRAADGLGGQAERLLADPRAEHAVQRFMSAWLQLDGGKLHHALEATEKDLTLYPQYDAALQQAMRMETEAFVRRAFFEQEGNFADLLSGNFAYVNGPLAELYGVSGGPADEATWEWVELDPSQRAGIFTRAAFLTVFSTRTVTAPIRRGVWVLEEVLCSKLGDPPPNANDVKVEGGVVEGELKSVRDDIIARTTNDPVCASCHNLINPIGFTFENYDALGRWQTEEVTTGLPVDASGYLGGSDVDGEVANAVELVDKLVTSDKVRACFAERWYTQALGREPGELDKCSLDAIEARFTETGSMRELVLAIIQSDAFRYLDISEETP
jgi:PAS domain-containing protein